MTSSGRGLGAEGERLAARWLEGRGYRVLACNVRAGNVELDLVVARGRLVVFVEVKTRRGSAHGPPELAVDARKQRRLARGAAAWLREHGCGFTRARFDVVACEPDDAGRWRLRHLPGAFEAG
jgi:putative endonuclease